MSLHARTNPRSPVTEPSRAGRTGSGGAQREPPPPRPGGIAGSGGGPGREPPEGRAGGREAAPGRGQGGGGGRDGGGGGEAGPGPHSLGGEEAQLLDLAQEAEEGPHLLRAGAGRDVGDLDHVGAAAGGHRAAARSAGAAADTQRGRGAGEARAERCGSLPPGPVRSARPRRPPARFARPRRPRARRLTSLPGPQYPTVHRAAPARSAPRMRRAARRARRRGTPARGGGACAEGARSAPPTPSGPRARES